MPANIIKINDVSEFYMGDSKMPALIKFLAENGFPENAEATTLLLAPKTPEAERVHEEFLKRCKIGLKQIDKI